jgi:hypothetical protein
MRHRGPVSVRVLVPLFEVGFYGGVQVGEEGFELLERFGRVAGHHRVQAACEGPEELVGE